MARDKSLWQNPNAAAVVLTGDVNEAAKWRVWANAKLRSMLQSTPGTTSNVFTPTEGVTVSVDSRPNRIEINAGGGLAIAIDDIAAPLVATLPDRYTGVSFWDVPDSAVAADFNRALQTRKDKLLFSTLSQYKKGGQKRQTFMTPPNQNQTIGGSMEVTYWLGEFFGGFEQPFTNTWMRKWDGAWDDGFTEAVSWVGHSHSAPPGGSYINIFPLSYRVFYKGHFGILSPATAPEGYSAYPKQWGVYGMAIRKKALFEKHMSLAQKNLPCAGILAVLYSSLVLCSGTAFTEPLTGAIIGGTGSFSTKAKIAYYMMVPPTDSSATGAAAKELSFIELPYYLSLPDVIGVPLTDHMGLAVDNGNYSVLQTLYSGFSENGRNIFRVTQGANSADTLSVDKFTIDPQDLSLTQTTVASKTLSGLWFTGASGGIGDGRYRNGFFCYDIVNDGNGATLMLVESTGWHLGAYTHRLTTDVQALYHINSEGQLNREYELSLWQAPFFVSVSKGFLWLGPHNATAVDQQTLFLRRTKKTGDWTSMRVPSEIESFDAMFSAPQTGYYGFFEYHHLPDRTEGQLQMDFACARGLYAQNTIGCLLKNTFVVAYGRKSSVGLDPYGTNGLFLVYDISTQDYALLPYNQESVVVSYVAPGPQTFWTPFFARATIVSTGSL